MRKLNPITALYLKILVFISFLLIEVGGNGKIRSFRRMQQKKIMSAHAGLEFDTDNYVADFIENIKLLK